MHETEEETIEGSYVGAPLAPVKEQTVEGTCVGACPPCMQHIYLKMTRDNIHIQLPTHRYLT